MSTYAVGDIQGCFGPFRALLEACGFDPRQDRLWLVGDLVNRGPQSLDVLRFVRGLGERATTVLGNHDLHLLAVAEGLSPPHPSDTFGDVLAAPDREELLHWLRHRPLLHREAEYAMVHAGLLPQWSVAEAAALAEEVEAALRRPSYRDTLAHMRGNNPRRWHPDLTGDARLRAITNAMTRMRFCTVDGAMEFAHKGALDSAPAGYFPWFDAPGRKSAGTTILFGHWSALGLMVRERELGLDSGCLWGRQLSAVRLEDRQVFQASCHQR